MIPLTLNGDDYLINPAIITYIRKSEKIIQIGRFGQEDLIIRFHTQEEAQKNYMQLLIGLRIKQLEDNDNQT